MEGGRKAPPDSPARESFECGGRGPPLGRLGLNGNRQPHRPGNRRASLLFCREHASQALIAKCVLMISSQRRPHGDVSAFSAAYTASSSAAPRKPPAQNEAISHLQRLAR